MKILFICQKEYFRQTIYDATFSGEHEVYYISSGDPSTIEGALDYCLSAHQITHICMFRPEWLCNFLEKIFRIKSKGIKLIGYSTEPLKHNFQLDSEVHSDQNIRFNNLLHVKNVDLDAFIHFDESSSEIVRKKIEKNAIFLPLPVSKKIFYPQATAKEFDSIFLGRSTEYRESFLNLPKSISNHLHVAHGMIDEKAALYTNKAEISYNIHNHSYLNFETRPVINLMCGVTTVSEVLTRDDLSQLRGFYTFSNFSEFENIFYNKSLEKPDPFEVEDVWRKLFDIKRLLKVISEI